MPDVAFVSLDRLRSLTREAIQAPTFGPTVAVEVLSPGDDPRDVASKIDVYLRAGSELAIVIDPVARTTTLYDPGSSLAFARTDTLRHSALPGFELPLARFFSTALSLQAHE